MDRSLVISALTNSWQNQNYPDNVILHSDRGSQYTSSDYIAAAERMGFRLSYSKKGCPFDNAPMESFHSVLKKEEVYLKHYSSFYEANIRLFDYIMAFIILIAFTRLLIICRPFILKNLYFLLNSFRLFVSNLLTMVQRSDLAIFWAIVTDGVRLPHSMADIICFDTPDSFASSL